ncbi:hypothetical protein TcasGA2_TC000776 [Tribolium castaneum]|uniref:Uncharacterized protein n=1 Tax=Tribolium castaneum TaxID=7070 RepID=D6WD36_TRICA|nr:hypothetical protein TcasGA2_TC000776 [Tribolium castaneum]
MMMLFDEKDSEYFKLQCNGLAMFRLNDGKHQETYFYHSVQGSFTFHCLLLQFYDPYLPKEVANSTILDEKIKNWQTEKKVHYCRRLSHADTSAQGGRKRP